MQVDEFGRMVRPRSDRHDSDSDRSRHGPSNDDRQNRLRRSSRSRKLSSSPPPSSRRRCRRSRSPPLDSDDDWDTGSPRRRSRGRRDSGWSSRGRRRSSADSRISRSHSRNSNSSEGKRNRLRRSWRSSYRSRSRSRSQSRSHSHSRSRSRTRSRSREYRRYARRYSGSRNEHKDLYRTAGSYLDTHFHPRKIFIRNLNDVSESTLRAVFGQFGSIKDFNMMANKGYAFIEYDTEDAATDARRKMDGASLGSARIEVYRATLREWNMNGFGNVPWSDTDGYAAQQGESRSIVWEYRYGSYLHESQQQPARAPQAGTDPRASLPNRKLVAYDDL